MTIYKLSEPRKPVATNKLTRTFVKDVYGEAVAEDSARFFRVALVARNKAFIGEVRHFYKTGELYSVATYAEGRPVGETKIYHKTGLSVIGSPIQPPIPRTMIYCVGTPTVKSGRVHRSFGPIVKCRKS